MAIITKTAAQSQLAQEVKWWRVNYNAQVMVGNESRAAWETRHGWSSRVGNAPSGADSFPASDYNSMANQWCGINTNVHKKRSEKVDTATGHKIFKEADQSVSGGKNTCHFIESWSDGNKFNWHFKLDT